jgi:hypothetical protein
VGKDSRAVGDGTPSAGHATKTVGKGRKNTPESVHNKQHRNTAMTEPREAGGGASGTTTRHSIAYVCTACRDMGRQRTALAPETPGRPTQGPAQPPSAPPCAHAPPPRRPARCPGWRSPGRTDPHPHLHQRCSTRRRGGRQHGRTPPGARTAGWCSDAGPCLVGSGGWGRTWYGTRVSP